jgi:hypothetical protein
VKDTATATSTVEIRVIVDPGTPGERIAEPGEVTFCEREQQLSATLQGIIENLDCFPEGVFDPGAPGCVLTPEEIELVLNTFEANAFFFALDDLGAGIHNVVVQAQIESGTSVQEGSAVAFALVGKGTVIVEEVRLATLDPAARRVDEDRIIGTLFGRCAVTGWRSFPLVSKPSASNARIAAAY